MPTPLPANAYEFLLVDDAGDGILLNGDAALPFVDITEVVGLDSSPYRETFRDHEGADGGFLDAEFEKGREVLLTGSVYSTQALLEGYLDSLKENYSPRTTPTRFYFYTPTIGVRFLDVKPRGVRAKWTTERRIGIVPVQFGMYAEDPRIYSYPDSQSVISLSAGSTTGFAFSFAFSFDFGGMGSSPGIATLNNAGNRSAPVTFTIVGPCDTPRIVNATNGGEIVVAQILAASDTLVVDMVNRTVVMNGTANRRNAVVVDDWFLLSPGNNVIYYQTVRGGTVPSTATADWNSAWR